MNKSILATSLLCALSGIASAQSSVTLYGVLDAGVSYMRIDGEYLRDRNNVGMAYGMQSGNRLGLKGVEDLGSGNKLTFVLENGFDLGNGTTEQNSRIFGRQAWFGVENESWGYARMGRQYNFATDYFGVIDPFMLGFGQASMGAAFGTTNMDRLSNAVKYQTPSFHGFQAGLGYAFVVGETAFYNNSGATPNAYGTTAYNYESANNNRQITLGAKYVSGPIYIAASYDKLIGTNAPVNASETNPSAWNLGASYDFNVAKLALAYGQSRGGNIRGQGDGMTGPNEGNNPYWGSNGGLLYFNQSFDSNAYLVGVTVPVNQSSRVFASWTLATISQGNNAANQSAYNIGYSYDFTKRTNMYAYFSYMNNLNNTDTNKSTGIGVGMRHMF